MTAALPVIESALDSHARANTPAKMIFIRDRFDRFSVRTSVGENPLIHASALPTVEKRVNELR